MAYKMTRISDFVRIGKRNDGTFDIEQIYEGDPISVFIDADDAIEIAIYILKEK